MSERVNVRIMYGVDLVSSAQYGICPLRVPIGEIEDGAVPQGPRCLGTGVRASLSRKAVGKS